MSPIKKVSSLGRIDNHVAELKGPHRRRLGKDLREDQIDAIVNRRALEKEPIPPPRGKIRKYVHLSS